MLVSLKAARSHRNLFASSSYFSSSIALTQTSGELAAATAADAVMIQKSGFKKGNAEDSQPPRSMTSGTSF
jgi:hypothetical protein